MKILTPFPVTDSTLTSINITEDDYAEWDQSTSYDRGDFVISTATHTVYRSLTDSNLDNDPDVEVAALADPLIDDPDPVNWQVISATNRWKLFDQKPSRLATNSGSIEIELTPEVFIGGVAGFGLSADDVRVEVYADAEKIYDRSEDLLDESAVTDWLAYFTEPYRPLTEFVFSDLPVLAIPRIVVTLTSTSTVSAGQIIFGRLDEMGVATQDTRFSGLDYSYVEVDEYGDLTSVQRPATRLFDINTVVPRENLFSIVQIFNRLRGGIPAVWIADENSRIAAIGYGFYRGYREVYLGPDHAEIAIEVQGVV
ncbi:hypothetical protein [Roseovarius sp. MMSF_3281]|uniref:hypothetical protein n=1 Tax=Roseovarius sp. MMSF_3281 TaxID=3046694 RepID=UPI00273FA9A7|nr:hypothetical protein [Roseovarius sp. MMSF_3281]